MGIAGRVKLLNKWEMDKIMLSLAIYGIVCLTVTVITFLLSLIAYFTNKKFRKVVNEEIRSYFLLFTKARGRTSTTDNGGDFSLVDEQ